MKRKKRVAAIITEYWDRSHADVIITKMLEGFTMDGNQYTSTLEIVSMYMDQFSVKELRPDMSRDMAAKHHIPIYPTVAETLKCDGARFDLDGIIIIGEHGDYPTNKYNQILYPRRRLFEQCLQVMINDNHIVPVYSDKYFAVVREDILWMYDQMKTYQIPFMSSSVIPFTKQYPGSQPPPHGAPLYKMFGFAYGDVETYTYHTLEMMQSIAENRSYGESGIQSVKAFEGAAAIDKLFSTTWNTMYRSLGGFVNLPDVEQFPSSLNHPLFFELQYVDGLMSGILYTEDKAKHFASAYQMYEYSEPFCTEFYFRAERPYIDFGTLVLEIEKFMHTSRPPFPVERSLLTSGALDAIMKSIYYKSEINTPYLNVTY